MNATLRFTNQGELTSTEEDNSESESTESEKEVKDEEVRNTSRENVLNIEIMTAQGNQIGNNGGMFGNNGFLQQQHQAPVGNQQQIPVVPQQQVYEMNPHNERGVSNKKIMYSGRM